MDLSDTACPSDPAYRQSNTVHIRLSSSRRSLKAGSFVEQSPHEHVGAPGGCSSGVFIKLPVLSDDPGPVPSGQDMQSMASSGPLDSYAWRHKHLQIVHHFPRATERVVLVLITPGVKAEGSLEPTSLRAQVIPFPKMNKQKKGSFSENENMLSKSNFCFLT